MPDDGHAEIDWTDEDEEAADRGLARRIAEMEAGLLPRPAVPPPVPAPRDPPRQRPRRPPSPAPPKPRAPRRPKTPPTGA